MIISNFVNYLVLSPLHAEQSLKVIANIQLLYTWYFSNYTQPIRCTLVLLSKILNSTIRTEHLVHLSAYMLNCQNLLNTWNIGNMLPNNLFNICLSLHCNHDQRLTQVHTNTLWYCDGNCTRFLTSPVLVAN